MSRTLFAAALFTAALLVSPSAFAQSANGNMKMTDTTSTERMAVQPPQSKGDVDTNAEPRPLNDAGLDDRSTMDDGLGAEGMSPDGLEDGGVDAAAGGSDTVPHSNA